MSLEQFRNRLREYLRLAGHNQKSLAARLDLSPTMLSNKLNGNDQARLYNQEVQQIVRLLVEWQAISEVAQVHELLGWVNCPDFEPQEWASRPFNQLVAAQPPRPERGGALPGLPVYLTRWVGRETEIETARQLLSRADVRLLTLLGPGGIGKTRLATETVRRLQLDFEDGVYFVSLTALTAPTLLAQTILTGLNQTPDARPPQECLLEFLRPRRLLIVLDNFEQLVSTEATGLVGDWLTAAPGLKLLITSRSVLHIYGEYQLEVPPLTLPTVQADPAQAHLSAAVGLFVERATTARRDFGLTAQNTPAVVEICRRLDGLPLALELAAAKVKFLGPTALLDRLQTHSRLQLLNDGPRDRPGRQQTLRSTLEWSYSLLQPAEQSLFKQLGVFAGEGSLEALAAVAQADPDATLELLSNLADQSMVRLESSDSSLRFYLLETLREYALEQLKNDPADVLNQTRRRHLEYFCSLAMETPANLVGLQSAEWLKLLDREYTNLRLALDWAILSDTQADSRQALQIVGSLPEYWRSRGYTYEARQRCQTSLAQAEKWPTLLHSTDYAKALDAAGLIEWTARHFDRALPFHERAVALYRVLAEKRGLANALLRLGGLHMTLHQYEQSSFLLEESRELAQELNDSACLSSLLINLGILKWREQKWADTRRYLQEALDLCRQMGYRINMMAILTNLALLEMDQGYIMLARQYLGEALEIVSDLNDLPRQAVICANLAELLVLLKDYDQAYVMLDRAETLYQEIHDQPGLSTIIHVRGLTALLKGDLFTARQYLVEGLKGRRGGRNQDYIAGSLGGLAELAAAQSQFERFARLYGAAVALREAIQTPAPPYEQSRLALCKEQALAALGPALYDNNYQAGATLPLETVLDYALEIESELEKALSA